MTRRRLLLLAALVIAACLGRLSGLAGIVGAESLPARLVDKEFWKLSADFSEPSGSFRSDNLLSNEQYFQYVIPDLTKTAKPDRVYMGVGPEQNFTYIAALKPKMVFIVDVRRGNLDLHLMYKTLFELSADRAEFVSRLFSKKRPAGLTTKSTATEIFAAYWNIETSEALYKDNLKAMFDLLTARHGFALSEEDRQGIEYVYNRFYWFGPSIQYNSSSGSGGGFGFRGNQPTYADLMVATDAAGQMRGFLASEESFALLKDLESKNLLVPVVGNFSGPKAIRAVSTYLKDKGATVSAFYLSNVEQYLMQDGTWRDFCANVATLPLDETSTFIRAARGGRYGPGFGLSSELGNMATEVKSCSVAAHH
jgi:hypothetical protein